jgi:hypothetical protein
MMRARFAFIASRIDVTVHEFINSGCNTFHVGLRMRSMRYDHENSACKTCGTNFGPDRHRRCKQVGTRRVRLRSFNLEEHGRE